MILKIAAILVVLYIVYIIFFKRGGSIPFVNSDSAPKKKKKIDYDEEMIECCNCKTFVSKDEAILSNGKFYCSKECIEEAK